MFVAESGSEVIGFVQIKLLEEARPDLQAMKYATVPILAVSEYHRSKGIGSNLMAKAEEWARDMGAEEVRLTAWDFNQSALKLYESINYEPRTRDLSKRLS